MTIRRQRSASHREKIRKTKCIEEREVIVVYYCDNCGDELDTCVGCGIEFKKNDMVYCKELTNYRDSDDTGMLGMYCYHKHYCRKCN